MNRFYLRTISYTLATIGFILGFTSKVLAQYGAWVASYKYMGNVSSEICNEPLNGIKVTLEDKNEIVLDETYTNEAGVFNISARSEGYDERLFLNFADVDGTKNNGEFLAHTETVLPSRNRNVDITLSYNGKIPCLEPLVAVEEKKTSVTPALDADQTVVQLPKQIPLIQQDTSSNILVLPNNNAIAIKPPKQTPLIPDPIDSVLIYPNPNAGCFTISYTLLEKGKITLKVYSSLGQLVYTENFISESGVQSRQLTMPGVAAGNYMLTISNKQKVVSKNIIIQQ
jgi:putative lipoprotein (rSAM/lipoprotein system)